MFEFLFNMSSHNLSIAESSPNVVIGPNSPVEPRSKTPDPEVPWQTGTFVFVISFGLIESTAWPSCL
jgi:hypothetical protein